MFENFMINVNGIWNIIDSYIKNLLTNPLSLITLILDLFIVIYLFTKFIIYAKKSRVWQLIKGIILFLIIVLLSEILQLKILNYILTVFIDKIKSPTAIFYKFLSTLSYNPPLQPC